MERQQVRRDSSDPSGQLETGYVSGHLNYLDFENPLQNLNVIFAFFLLLFTCTMLLLCHIDLSVPDPLPAIDELVLLGSALASGSLSTSHLQRLFTQ